jgi:hypothetical protein
VYAGQDESDESDGGVTYESLQDGRARPGLLPRRVSPAGRGCRVVNEEIDIDDDEDDGAQIQQVAVPAAVFGAAGMDVVASEAGNGMGALERFKRAQGL